MIRVKQWKVDDQLLKTTMRSSQCGLELFIVLILVIDCSTVIFTNVTSHVMLRICSQHIAQTHPMWFSIVLVVKLCFQTCLRHLDQTAMNLSQIAINCVTKHLIVGIYASRFVMLETVDHVQRL